MGFSQKSAIVNGIATVGLLVSATSVLKTITGWFDYSLGEWLKFWISAYQSLFYPLFDIPFEAVFGFKIPQPIKDLSVFYVAFGVSFVKVMNFDDSMKLHHKIKTALSWPVMVGFVTMFYFLSIFDKRFKYITRFMTFSNDDGIKMQNQGSVALLISVFREFMKILVVVVVALVLNSAGILN